MAILVNDVNHELILELQEMKQYLITDQQAQYQAK